MAEKRKPHFLPKTTKEPENSRFYAATKIFLYMSVFGLDTLWGCTTY